MAIYLLTILQRNDPAKYAQIMAAYQVAKQHQEAGTATADELKAISFVENGGAIESHNFVHDVVAPIVQPILEGTLAQNIPGAGQVIAQANAAIAAGQHGPPLPVINGQSSGSLTPASALPPLPVTAQIQGFLASIPRATMVAVLAVILGLILVFGSSD